MAKHLVDQVELGAFKPAGARHVVAGQDAFVRRSQRKREEGQDGAPEALQVGHRPLPQRLIVLEAKTAFAIQPGLEARDHGPCLAVW
ncbi:hypothetical protein D3C71_1927970 [compost metagenome]